MAMAMRDDHQSKRKFLGDFFDNILFNNLDTTDMDSTQVAVLKKIARTVTNKDINAFIAYQDDYLTYAQSNPEKRISTTYNRGYRGVEDSISEKLKKMMRSTHVNGYLREVTHNGDEYRTTEVLKFNPTDERIIQADKRLAHHISLYSEFDDDSMRKRHGFEINGKFTAERHKTLPQTKYIRIMNIDATVDSDARDFTRNVLIDDLDVLSLFLLNGDKFMFARRKDNDYIKTKVRPVPFISE